MTQRFAIVLALVAFAGCKRYVVRDGKTYNAELAWFEKAGAETAELSAELVKRGCTCDEDGYFEDDVCEELADNVVTIRARMSWHVEMARYNAQLTNERPSKDPPEIPPAESLCPGDEQ